jgi:hypothetical protein
MTDCAPKPNSNKFNAGCTEYTTVFWGCKDTDATPQLLFDKVTCVAGQAVHTIYRDKAGTILATGYTLADKCTNYPKAPEKGASCEDPLYVTVCQPAAKYDREMQVLCAPDGSKVAVQNVTPDTAPLGTAPIFEAWNLDGSAWGGNVATLADCATERVDIAAAAWFCVSGQSVSRTDFWDIASVPRTLLGSVWQDASGAAIAAPAAGTYTVGECSTCPVRVASGVSSTWG